MSLTTKSKNAYKDKKQHKVTRTPNRTKTKPIKSAYKNTNKNTNKYIPLLFSLQEYSNSGTQTHPFIYFLHFLLLTIPNP